MSRNYANECRITIHEHRNRVSANLNKAVQDLLERSINHDNSKLENEEFLAYASVFHEFTKHKFGTKGYQKAKEKIAGAIKHHVTNNRHHPEYFKEGVNDMNLIDLVEMISDWQAATLNNPDNPGDILKSIENLSETYKISPQLKKILRNTVRDFDMI